MADIPKLYVCHADDAGPKLHPCRRAHEALRDANVEYTTVIGGHGSPFPCWRGNRDEMFGELGTRELPTLKLPDGTLLINPSAIIKWARQQKAAKISA